MKANAALNAGDLVAAGSAYDLAYHEARIVFAEAWNGSILVQPHAPPMLIVSATNVAHHRRVKGDEAAATAQLISAIQIFTEALNSERAPQSLKRGCAEHLPRLLADLTDNDCDTNPIAEDAKAAALAYWKKCAH